MRNQSLAALLALASGVTARVVSVTVTERVNACPAPVHTTLPLPAPLAPSNSLADPGANVSSTPGGSSTVLGGTSLVEATFTSPGAVTTVLGVTSLVEATFTSPGASSTALILPTVASSGADGSAVVILPTPVSSSADPGASLVLPTFISNGAGNSTVLSTVLATDTSTFRYTNSSTIVGANGTVSTIGPISTGAGISILPTNTGIDLTSGVQSSVLETVTGINSTSGGITTGVATTGSVSSTLSQQTASASSSNTVSSSSTISSAIPSSTGACSDYYLETIRHQGLAPYAASGYTVFRSVKDFGAKGDGVTDDTAAINAAISSGNRCGPADCGPGTTTTTPAIVYFPPGTYLVSSPIIDYYYTNIIGNPDCLPVILASPTFQVGQATSLQNIVFQLSTDASTQHQGLFIEEGSGGFIGDLVFYGGKQAMSIGNQQFTMRNLTFFNAQTAIQQLWNWGWTYKGLNINNCGVGIDMTAITDSNTLTVGGVVVVDSVVSNTPVFLKYGNPNASGPDAANNIVLENIQLSGVPVAVQSGSGATILSGESGAVTAWANGHRYTGYPTTGPTAATGSIDPNTRPAGLVSGTEYYERSKPQYENEPLASFVSIRTSGAAGDGTTDDTAIINSVLAAAAAQNNIVFFDAGVYVVSDTIVIPPGSRIVGEAYPVILAAGTTWGDINNPKPVVQVGQSGQTGVIEWSDMIISTRGAQPGAILIEWNLASTGTPSGMWDVHTRIGGFAGSNLQVAQCVKTPETDAGTAGVNTACIAAFMSMHITASAQGVYMENVWLWVADHDVEDAANTQITVYAGRGLLVESQQGNIWMYGTAVEHHTLYQYQLANTANIVMGQVQTETAYYQPNPDATIPFTALAAYNDPVIPAGGSGWGLRLLDSNNIDIYGMGLYSFFSNNNVTCSNQGNGEACQSRIFSVENSGVSVYNLNTVGTTNMITLDGQDIALYSDNLDGFVDSINLFRATPPA
ncbi:hypothetical protein DL546_006880 [Coniochaeta pulveracea]|uniref:Rhamnogalacturonase A/B/Epimerase-like pectate lyase domain-containing protein n=1 Tax=Coniochaeta pulveracea TaxID=177199 RepID=A0A420Y845_9PEZI|nr:hypothetical protein DL546_006880 [Coniochaeta pulveracea]